MTVVWNKLRYVKPVLSHTGTLRLRDVTGRTLMIQIANKSMLDVKAIVPTASTEQDASRGHHRAAREANPSCGGRYRQVVRWRKFGPEWPAASLLRRQV